MPTKLFETMPPLIALFGETRKIALAASALRGHAGGMIRSGSPVLAKISACNSLARA